MNRVQAWVACVGAAGLLAVPQQVVHAKAAWGSIGKYEVHLVSVPGSRWIIVTDPGSGDTQYGHEHGGTASIGQVGIGNGSPATLVFTDGLGGTTPIAPGESLLGPHLSGSNLHIDLAEIGVLDDTTNKDVVVDLLFDNIDPATHSAGWQMRLEFGGHGVSGLDGARLYALELDDMGNVLDNLFASRFGFDFLPIDYSNGYLDIMFVPPMMVPEPSTWALGLAGAGAFAATAWRRRRRSPGRVAR